MGYLTIGRALTPRSFPSESLWRDPFRNFFTGTGAFAGLEIARTDDGGFRVEVPVAGYKPDEIDVTLEESVLTISGKSEKRQFTRSLLLPEDIDGDAVTATVEHGLLTLGLARHPKAQPKKIAVSFNG